MRTVFILSAMVMSLSITASAFAAAATQPVVEPIESGPTGDQSGPGSTAIAPPVEVKLQNMRWQGLPAVIESVAVSPDKRLWYLMRQPEGAAPLRQTAVREVVQREFAKPSPQLQGVRRVYFETAGTAGDEATKLKRVWMFCGSPLRLLLGYDGKQWIERRSKGAGFCGMLPASRSFFQLDDGIAVFDSFGCHILRGAKWVYQDFEANEQGGRTILDDQRVWPDADGKGLTVITEWLQPRLWRYREGVWRELPWPRDLSGISPAKVGQYIYAVKPYSLVGQSPANLAYLRHRPPPRLVRIGLDGKVEKIEPTATVKIGRYRIPPTDSMYNTLDGTFYAWCEEAWQGTKKLGPGVVICDPAGKSLHVPVDGDQPLDLFTITKATVLLKGGELGWIGNLLMDLRTLTQVGQIPDPQCRVIAVTDDGTVYVQQPSHSMGEPPGRVMAYRAAVVDARNVLRGEAVPGTGHGYCIASDGCIWAVSERATAGLIRFDGRTWQPCEIPSNDGPKVRVTPHALIPAQNGWVYAFASHRVSDLKIIDGGIFSHFLNPQYLLLKGRKCTGDTPLKQWISQQRELFLEAFSKPSMNRPWYDMRPLIARTERGSRNEIGGTAVINRDLEFDDAGVVVDKDKNVWASSLGSVCVVTLKRAIDVSIPQDRGRPAAGPRHVASIALLGDGDFVLLCLVDRATFFVRLDADGDLDFSRGPNLESNAPLHPLRDRQGGLWVTVANPRGVALMDGRLTGIIVRRLIAPDKAQDFNDVGEPALVDAAGCVWLVPKRGGSGEKVTIWAPGGDTSKLTIPGRAADSVLTAGPLGRVFAWTSFGLQECVAKDPTKPSAYTLGAVYRLEGMESVSRGGLQYSSLGYLVGASSELHLFPLRPSQLKPADTPGQKTGQN